MPGRIRKPLSIAAALDKFYNLTPPDYYEACYQLLSVELRKSIRTQDWVLIAAVREVAYARGILHQFIKAWEVVRNSIEAGDHPPAVMAKVRLEEVYSANIKDRPDRVGEFEDSISAKPTPEELTQFPLYYNDKSFLDTPQLIQRSTETRKNNAVRGCFRRLWTEVNRLGLSAGHYVAVALDRAEREMI